MRNKKIVLTKVDKQQISTKFFELFIERGKVFLPENTYQLTKLSKKFGVDRQKLALFVIAVETDLLQKNVKKQEEKTNNFKNYFKLQ